MGKVTKRELAKVLEENFNCNTFEAIDVVDKLFDVIRDGVINGSGMEVRGFGTIRLVERKSKTVQNISRKETYIIPAWKKPVFKPSKDFIKLAN